MKRSYLKEYIINKVPTYSPKLFLTPVLRFE